MRLAFMGSPPFAVATLNALLTTRHEIAAVYTQPPRPAGRGQAVNRSAVHARAEALGLPVHTPPTFRDPAARETFAALDLDVAVVAAYGLILPEAVLALPRRGCLNVHASLLPRWRGAAPIQRAIMAGDDETGVTIMQMERGLDTGPMLATSATTIDRKTAGELTNELAEIGAALMIAVLDDPLGYAPRPQPEAGASHAPKIDKAEARLDFNRPAIELERAIRAHNPTPGAFTEVAGERLRILMADVVGATGEPGTILDEQATIACGEGSLRPTLVQRSGRPAMSAAALLNGWPIPAGTRVG